MWSPKVISVQKGAGRITVRVEYSDGTEKFEEEYSSTSRVSVEWLKSQVRARVQALTDSYAFAETLSIGQSVDITEPTPYIPTQADLDRDQFLKDYMRWQQVKKAIDIGILTGNETKVVDLKNKVVNAFKLAYLDFI